MMNDVETGDIYRNKHRFEGETVEDEVEVVEIKDGGGGVPIIKLKYKSYSPSMKSRITGMMMRKRIEDGYMEKVEDNE